MIRCALFGHRRLDVAGTKNGFVRIYEGVYSDESLSAQVDLCTRCHYLFWTKADQPKEEE